MHEIEIKCPKKKCKGYAQASVSSDEGNTEAPCDECNSQIGFHYLVETDGANIIQNHE